MSNDNYALLVAASYADFSGLNKNDIEYDNKVQEKLTLEEIPDNFAEQFTDNYDIISQKNTASGYSGTVVKNKKTNEFFVLHRGTQPKDSRDLVQDAILVVGGLPYCQLTDAKQFVNEQIRNGNIKGNFTNIGHSLGKSIADLVHFTNALRHC